MDSKDYFFNAHFPRQPPSKHVKTQRNNFLKKTRGKAGGEERYVTVTDTEREGEAASPANVTAL